MKRFALPLLAVAALSHVAPAQTISNGNYSVSIDPVGVIVDPSAGGLEATFGPRIALERGVVEVYGVSFDTPSGHVTASGSSKPGDYAHRTPVTPVSTSFTANGGVVVTRAGTMEIEQTFSFDDFTGCLVVGVSLRNVGRTQIRNIMFSREWRAASIAGGTFPPEYDMAMPRNPGDVWRIAWMPNNLLPGASGGCVLALDPSRSGAGFAPPPTVDVPLVLWTSPSWPSGVTYGNTYGISFGDYDHDGWIDVTAAYGAKLWRNLAGADWVQSADLASFFPKNSLRYGCAMADYDDDQLLDIGTEPRSGSDDKFHLLHNLGNATFDEVADDPNVLDVRPTKSDTETNSVADVDGDGDLDWFLPTYPSWIGGPGNWFLKNLGPNSSGAYTFHEASAEAGLDNPPQPVNRPEGAEFCDVDNDGDLDLYSNNTIYRNVSTYGSPLFDTMTEAGSGVVFSDILDEGAGFLDYDMDGDMDLCIAFCDSKKGVRMFENKGDGSFAVQGQSLFDSYNTGLCLGLSFEDWDNDGDVDVTSSEVFRRNQWQETGVRHFTVATHSIPSGHITDATPSWGDVDKDGDLDCALGNWGEKGRYYMNTTYDASTPAGDRRYLRVRVVRDSAAHDDGLESEFGAQVTVIPLNHPVDGQRRTKVVSSSGGYLNQNEYVLHFALPSDPDPDPSVDLEARVIVDFKGTKDQGVARVDRHVNAALGNIRLADLADREIVVYRSGRVKIDGLDFEPELPSQSLTTCNEGLALPGLSTPLPAPSAAPGSDWFVGAEISTAGASAPLRLEEIAVDGTLASAVNCSGTFANLFVWDVTHPASPQLAAGGLRNAPIRSRNDRTYYAIDATLLPGRVYRVAARVTKLRATAITQPVVDGPVATNGGISYSDSSPCDGAAIAAASLDPASLYLTVRFRDEPSGAWADAGHALAGSGGAPTLVAAGDLRPDGSITVDLDGALPNAPVFVVFGEALAYTPFAGGVIVPSIDAVFSAVCTDAAGHWDFSDTMDPVLPAGALYCIQALIADPGAPHGFAFSNAVVGASGY